MSSLTPSLSWRTERAIASEAQIQSPTHNPAVMPASHSSSEGSFSSTPPLSSLFHSPNPSFSSPDFVQLQSKLIHSISRLSDDHEDEGEHDRADSTCSPPTMSLP